MIQIKFTPFLDFFRAPRYNTSTMFVSSQYSANSLPPSTSWDPRPETAANQAIQRFDLSNKGWRGFDEIPWVGQLKTDYPQAYDLATTCSSHRPEFEDQARELFSQAPPQDRQRLQDYFAGKAGLEELSCRRSGAGAGMCDKRSAYYRIFEISQEFVGKAGATGGAAKPGLYL